MSLFCNTVLGQQAKTYDEAILIGNSLLSENKFNEAIDYYQIALLYKSDDEYATKQVNTIADELMSTLDAEELYLENIDIADVFQKKYHFDDAIRHYLKALAIIPNDAYAKGKINSIRAIQTLLDTDSEEFNQLITSGIVFLNMKHFADATRCFKKARKILPRNTGIKVLLSKTKEAETMYFSVQEAFDKEIELAYNFIVDSNYIEAIVHLNIAHEIDPDNWAVINEITKYNPIVYEQLGSQTDIEDVNNTIVNEQTQPNEVSVSSYVETDEYNTLDNIELNEVQVQVNEVEDYRTYATINIISQSELNNTFSLNGNNDVLQKQLAFDETENEMAIMQNEILIAREKVQRDINQQFQELVAKGNSLFSIQLLNPAKIVYTEALDLKPNNDSVQTRINEIDNQILEINAERARNYNVTIANADRLYEMKSYDKAIGIYRKSSLIMPKEDYPKEMAGKILKMMEDNIVVDIVNSNIIIKSSTTEVFAFDPVNVNVRRSNYLFMKATNLSGNSYKIIINYGSDKGKNGGFVVQVPEGQFLNDYIIRVGNQYKWFADNNNWISIYPENGDVEISLIQISKSD